MDHNMGQEIGKVQDYFRYHSLKETLNNLYRQVRRKCLTSYGIAETEIHPIENMGFSHFSVMIVKCKVETFLDSST